MLNRLSRRTLFQLAGTGAAGLAGASTLLSQSEAPPPKPVLHLAPEVPFTVPSTKRSPVSLVRGEDRRKNVYEALMGIDAELRPALRRKKYVLIKPNLTAPLVQIADTHPDAILGILDYLAPRFKGPVSIAESAAFDTMVCFDNWKYHQIVSEAKSQKVSLLDLNLEERYVPMSVVDYNVHATPIRIAARLLDPDAFVICAAVPKTHVFAVVTASVKNMAVGGTLRSGPKGTQWSDKGKVHGGFRAKGSPGDSGSQQMNYNLMLVAQKMAPNWGATVLDGYEGMEGEGPVDGVPVPSRIAIASMDYIAADRVAVEAMGINPAWMGYLQYLEQAGVGNYDIAKIDVRGETIAAVRKTYKPASTIERALEWSLPLVPTTKKA
jgi:uncharacterized protein (DUF362 family)